MEQVLAVEPDDVDVHETLGFILMEEGGGTLTVLRRNPEKCAPPIPMTPTRTTTSALPFTIRTKLPDVHVGVSANANLKGR